tara:strand:+ start:2270 stop:5710 length:3441 start_codon:yes stop_codon:yes gene_type:complete
MKVNIKKLPKGYSVVNGKIVNTMAYGGSSTGDQQNYGLITTPPSPTSNYDYTQSESPASGKIASSLPGVPREEANLEAEKGETVLTDMNNDGNFELYNIGGKRHHNGGTPLNLPPQSFIFSDTSKMKLDKYELAEMGITSKKKITPAKVSKGYELNKFMGILDDDHSDNISIDTAEYMLNKNKKSLSQLAFLQEAKKEFEDGVPLASYAYLTGKGIDPIQFSQQVEQITEQEAQQKMMMQLPYEQRLQMQMLKQQLEQQQQVMAQQQPKATMQGMMPPQAQMQDPTAGQMNPFEQMPMAKRGGQISNLYKAQLGMETGAQNFRVPQQQFEFVDAPDLSSASVVEDNTNYLPIHTQPANMMAYATQDYINDQMRFMDEYRSDMELEMNKFASRFNPAELTGMNLNSNIYDPEMVDFWEEHIKMGGTPPNTISPEYTEAYGRVYPNAEPPSNSNENEEGMSTSYFPENGNQDDEDNELLRHGNVTFAKGVNPNTSNSENFVSFDAAGLPLNYTNTDDPYYVGSQFASKYGGDVKAQDGVEMVTPFEFYPYTGLGQNPLDSYNLPYENEMEDLDNSEEDLLMAQRGLEYNGRSYSKRDLRRLSRNNPQFLAEILNGGPVRTTPNISELIEEINKLRIDEEGSDTRETLVGGTESWINEYQSDTEEATKYRDERYLAYKTRRESEGLTVLPAEEYHDLYVKFQKQNEWFNENLTQEERNTKDWDLGTPNVKYRRSLEGSGFEPLSKDQISHVQSGYIGGVAMDKVGADAFTTYQQTGVLDQSVFDLPISPEDGVFGNTTNDELENLERGQLIEATPCANADELSVKCNEAGGVWTPYDAKTKTGCSCSENIIEDASNVEEYQRPRKEFWLQDELALMNAMDNRLSLKKYYPWAPTYDNINIDPVFKDPTREIAAIAEQATIAANTASTFAGPQRAAAVQAKTQGVAGKQIADTIDNIQSYNVNLANAANVKNAELDYKTQVLNNNELKQLYDNTMLTEQNYDNALREANTQITKQMINAYTNAANTYNLNSIYPTFDINPQDGGTINITDPKEFFADPNYVDPKTSYEQYALMYNNLINKGVPEDKIPGFQGYKGKPKSSRAKRNQAVITAGYQTGNQMPTSAYGTETKREKLLKKGAELRNFFSPLKGY